VTCRVNAVTRRAAIFDVNETMLDLGALDPLFADWFGDAGARAEWFAQTIHYALTLAATRICQSFADVGAASLTELARRRDRTLPQDAAIQLRTATLSLPPHADVLPALTRLHHAGFLTAALSNNPKTSVQTQMRHAGLDSILDRIMSVEEVGALKPSPEVYRFAIDRLGTTPAATWMIAAHGWDIAGAMRSGLRGAFVSRPGQYPDPLAVPDIVAANLVDLAEELISRADVE
jgi:2-haloacid dehalogenase